MYLPFAPCLPPHCLTLSLSHASFFPQQDVNKIEFDVPMGCYGAVAYSITEGFARPAQYQLKPYPTVKINNINKVFLDAVDTEVCLVLKSPCPTLFDLCGGSGRCTYAIFNQRVISDTTAKNSPNAKCCPVRSFSTLDL